MKMRLLLLTILIMASATFTIASAQTGDFPCARCDYINPPANKFCNKCGSPLNRLIEPGFVGHISSIEDRRVVIDAGSAAGIEKGDLLEVRKIIDVTLIPATGDTLGFRRKPSALIEIDDVTFRVSYGSYRTIGKSIPRIGDAVYPRKWSFRDHRLLVSVLTGFPLVDKGFPLGPDASWGGQGSGTFQAEYVTNPFLGLGVQFGFSNFESGGDSWNSINYAPFAKLHVRTGRHSLFVKSLLGLHSGVLDRHYTDLRVKHSGPIGEIACGYWISVGSRFAVHIEYTLGWVDFPNDSSLFPNPFGSYSRIEGGLIFAAF